MATRNIKAPSGLTGTVRNLKGKEANILADKTKARALKTFDDILTSCWEHTEEVPEVLTSHYLNGSGQPAWGHVLLGDRMYVLVQIRIATYGSKYTFKHKCKVPTCGESFEWEIDLDKDIECQPYPKSMLEAFANGEPISAELPDGTHFKFTLMTGDDERSAAKRIKKKKDELVTVSLSERIVEIEGVGTSRKAILAYLEEMALDDQYEIIDIMDAADGGYDTDIEVECPECGNEDVVRLPFAGDFWISPRRRRKKAAAEV